MSDLGVCNKVFVYGTLKKGHSNSRIFDAFNADWLGPVSTVDKYILGDVGFPYMFPEGVCSIEDYKKYSKVVRGDLWVIPNTKCLAALDRIEGVPNHYVRELIEVEGGLKVWAYLQRDPTCLQWCYMCDVTNNNEWEWSSNYGY